MNFDCLPDGWEFVKLGDIIFVKNGYAFKSSDYSLDGIPLIRISDIKDGKVLIDNAVKIPIDQCKNDFLIKKGDLLIAMSGATTGKTGVYEEKQASLQNQRVGNFKIKYDNILDQRFRDFLIYFLRQEIEKIAYGGAQPNISSSQLEKIIIPLPPLNEQKRIVNKIENLQDKRAKVKAELEAIARLIPQFRQSVLAAAFRGDLTDNWRKNNPDVESAELLLEKIKIERRQKWEANELEKMKAQGKTPVNDHWKKKYQEPETVIDVDDLPDIPDSWCWVNLGNLCHSFQYGTSQKSQKEGKIPVLRMGNLQNGKIDWNDLVYTSDEDEITKFLLKPNTVLFNRTNSPELVGKTSIYKGEYPAIFAGYLIRINNYKQLDSNFLNYALNTHFAKVYFWDVKTDGVSQSNINAQKLAQLKIPFCSLEEQKEIVRKIETAFKFADRIETEIKTALEELENLNQSILAKAFRGELVPQISTDEPASMLLYHLHLVATQIKHSQYNPNPLKTG